MKGICSDECVDDTIKMMMIIVIAFAVYYDIDLDDVILMMIIHYHFSTLITPYHHLSSYFNTYYHLNVANEMIEEYDLSYKGIFIIDTCDCFYYILINKWIFLCLTFISPS
jgi:hypothetical protein